ncbi:hypothetical protein QJS10_CPB04g00573 [Acorus calamus]|uniref:Uncharacterized protein n=1 Tax=Acorus calamus TaxID=4465 RepID=A0AAV9F2Q0_ACOCL|nr:hypothetical protein QJS10_CPB04g00573 [Acorus calamus]
MAPPSTIYEAAGEAVGHGGGVLFCMIIIWLSVISWITFAWGGGFDTFTPHWIEGVSWVG